MKENVAGNVHRKLYGVSDKINAPENQDREFQEGYRVGASSMAYSAELVLKEEFILRIKVDDDLDKGFDEWQRGFWAARSQSILFVSPRGHRKCEVFRGGLLTNENSNHIGNHLDHSICVHNGFWHTNQQAFVPANPLIRGRDTL